MDKSVDSIGSCSLDVDADTTDFSDTSGSLNLPTPNSLGELEEISLNIFRSVTQINDKCSTEVLEMTDSNALELEIRDLAFQNNSIKLTNHGHECSDKKPSYLNLACCVNGYSNLTTYDSKIRQDINKSREVSPIRPSSNSVQYCKKSNSLAPPVLLTLPDTMEKNIDNDTHREKVLVNNEENINGKQQSSFIQQRVERLYGPGALAQGFYSPRRTSDTKRTMNKNIIEDSSSNSELTRKFKELSPSKDYIQFKKNLKKGNHIEVSTMESVESMSKNNFDLPVLRHLSHEFRAQLPAISPKKYFVNISDDRDNDGKFPCQSVNVEILKIVNDSDVVDKANKVECFDEKLLPVNTKTYDLKSETIDQLYTQSNGLKDGNYFLMLLKDEQSRLLSLADSSERYIECLSNNPDIGDDVFGLLRAATGKARLLVNQKLKQFEGLCHKNLNLSPEDKFPTTCDDLQGFWDMVNLQIDHVNSIFLDIEKLKENNWKRENEFLSSNYDSSSLTLNNTPKSVKPTILKAKLNGNKSDKSPVASAAALKREMQRKQLLEMKRKKKLEMAENLSLSTNQTQHIADDNNIEHNTTKHNSNIQN